MAKLTKVMTYHSQQGVEMKLTLPAKYEVCPTCAGRGRAMTRTIREHAYSREEMDDDPDFKEAYFTGGYDVTCDECSGERVVLILDIDKCDTPRFKRALHFIRLSEAEERTYQRECAMERMMGA